MGSSTEDLGGARVSNNELVVDDHPPTLQSHGQFIGEEVRQSWRWDELFVIDAVGQEGLYVQGGRVDERTLHLEAADLDRWQTGHLDDEQVAALEGLGFSRGEINFAQRITVTGEDDACQTAARVLSKVFEIYGVSERHALSSDDRLSSDDPPVASAVDMEEYDRQLIEWGFVFEDDPDDEEEPETDLTFLVDPSE
jgi:hypothetical protein